MNETVPPEPPVPNRTTPPGQRIAGTVVRVTFQNAENGYAVIKLAPGTPVQPGRLQPDGLATLVGAMPGIEAGQPIQAEGEWVRDAKFGWQMRVAWFKPTLPSGVMGIRAYLASGSIKGMGPVLAAKIVAAFGERTLEVLENEPERLREIPGFGRKTHLKIIHGWREARGDRELIIFLGDHGVAPGVAARLRKVYGPSALSVVRANPYQLTQDVRGIGFRRADEIAQKIGLAKDAPERIDAALAHALQKQADEGHTCLPRPALEAITEELLGIEREKIVERLETALLDKRIAAEMIEGQPMLFLPALHEAEQRAAYRARRIAEAKRRLPQADPIAAIADFEQRSRIALAEAQRRAVLTFGREGLMILTGGPGTGKTTTVRAIIDLFLVGRRVVKLAAPTGRAARRLAETAKLPAETLHRLLGFQPHTGKFLRDATHPIEADLVIVDESSMLDAALAANLFEAVSPGTCLLLIGDEDQLPSVGPGNVLGDLIASSLMPLVRLTEVFRQAGQSLIVVNAHRINKGLMPYLKPPPGGPEENGGEPDFYFIEREEPADVIETIKTLASERIPKRFGLNPLTDLQILTPMRRGELGVDAINAALKGTLNPGAKAEAGEGPAIFGGDDDDAGIAAVKGRRLALTAGDRVMQTANNYDKGAFNGDIGRVESVDPKTREAIVKFEGRSISYLSDELDQIVLAYATTIHKSQGSEYPAVIIPVHTQHWIMLQRNLIYTALTRARRLVCMVGTQRALRRAVGNGQRAARYTALKFFLREGDSSHA